jgi:hypothetical protein
MFQMVSKNWTYKGDVSNFTVKIGHVIKICPFSEHFLIKIYFTNLELFSPTKFKPD